MNPTLGNGGYVVEMLFKPEISEPDLGNSKNIASKRLNYLYRLDRDPVMGNLCSEFIKEYSDLSRMN